MKELNVQKHALDEERKAKQLQEEEMLKTVCNLEAKLEVYQFENVT